MAKVLSFAQQRPRAVCVLSGNGTVSSVTLRQPASTGVSVTYEVEELFYLILHILFMKNHMTLIYLPLCLTIYET